MIVNQSNLAILNQAFSAAFRGGLASAAPMWSQCATLVPSTTSEQKYGWLGKITKFREWIGERQYQNLVQHDYAVKNKTWENTVQVSRDEIEDDQYGVYSPVIEQLGQDAALHPDEMVFGLLKAGFATPCYDGQYFFDTDHPVGAPGAQVSVSNFQGGSGTPWFLLDTSKVLKPVIYQKRREYQITPKTSLTDDNVFSQNQFIWGADGRGNVGFGLWQLAYSSREALNVDSYADARASHQSIVGDNGKPLVIRSQELWVPPSLEQAALEVVTAERLANGATNVMRNLSKVVVCPWLI
ncbi:Mu-like prophage major head subunit gpT family protein [Acidovorax sp. SUPP1855]|uniref:Mu-like prophage major head subunit gpT family protein n=1 Tax=Acidovorax sp. SUPP1855 TaxID=431774 RepID=UPI0023DE2DD4|nr:Mu-like prophage major head subunit gpT family protein [Acidovorax sp. SUPP1855]GKS87153.1 Mu-like prophage major head subunit gpT family protein [Acidovorax sp. SUPP1855]